MRGTTSEILFRTEGICKFHPNPTTDLDSPGDRVHRTKRRHPMENCFHPDPSFKPFKLESSGTETLDDGLSIPSSSFLIDSRTSIDLARSRRVEVWVCVRAVGKFCPARDNVFRLFILQHLLRSVPVVCSSVEVGEQDEEDR